MSLRRIRRLASLFIKARRCPACGWVGYRFDPFGNAVTKRNDAQCPICGSLERHRLALMLLSDRISRGQRVLHVAPEPPVVPWLLSRSSEYLNIDLHKPAMQAMDLTALNLSDQSKTLVWCSHVLEHIPDDRKALEEIYRVLEPGGLLVLQVPIRGDTTYEDPSITSEAQRLEAFLQEDHVRFYGLDLQQRIEAVGFTCTVRTAGEFPAAERRRHGIDAAFYREVFVCSRPHDARETRRPE